MIDEGAPAGEAGVPRLIPLVLHAVDHLDKDSSLAQDVACGDGGEARYIQGEIRARCQSPGRD